MQCTLFTMAACRSDVLSCIRDFGIRRWRSTIALRSEEISTLGLNEEVSEATCFGCSIRVRGHVSGDVTAFGGSIVVEDQGQIGGDLTTFGGSLRLGEDANVSGDVAVFGGTDSARIPPPLSAEM